MKELKNYRDLDLMSTDAARSIRDYMIEVLRDKKSFSLILSGGSILQPLYRTLFYIDSLPWEKIHFFITDERCLPNKDLESNFQSAVKNLLKRSNIPLQNIHWINPEINPLEQAAKEYENTLVHYLGSNDNSFDLVLLTMGPDGHVASLFPGFAALMEKRKLVVLTDKALLDPRVQRITMTLPALNKTRRIMFFLSDENCSSILEEIMGRQAEDKFNYPAELVRGSENYQIWYILRN
ncbi:MAG: 6-phosphogluconolactonase [Spirochaetales bacterium]|nr:6-phosphogluconolactonase [Spirochaetales bacterium]